MEKQRGLFPKLLLSAFGLAILAFLVRGFTQLAVGMDTARLLAAPVFGLALLASVVAFVLSLLVKIGVFGDQPEA